MSFLKKGPEVKLSALKDVKVPGFLRDVYYDLKDRHLLPIALILVVAIVAVPIAISDSGSEPGAASGGAEASASGGAVDAETTGALVAKAAPGLRKYEQRLEAREASNPFKQKYQDAEDKTEGEATGSESTGTSTEPTEYSSYPPSTEQSSSDPDGDGESGTLTHYSYAIDVRVSGGSGDKKQSSTRKNLPELTMLPSRSTPALAFVGPTKDGKKAVMIVSSDVKTLFGDNRCVLGSETCEMLVLEPGLPETIVYGGAEKTYTVELLKVELIKTSELNRAALGKQKNGKKSDRLADTVGLSDVYQR